LEGRRDLKGWGRGVRGGGGEDRGRGNEKERTRMGVVVVDLVSGRGFGNRYWGQQGEGGGHKGEGGGVDGRPGGRNWR